MTKMALTLLLRELFYLIHFDRILFLYSLVQLDRSDAGSIDAGQLTDVTTDDESGKNKKKKKSWIVSICLLLLLLQYI